MPNAPVDVAAALDTLERNYGAPPAPVPRTPFGWIVYENASYLVDDERRERVFRAIEKRTGLDPERIAKLSDAALLSLIADGGMLAPGRAEKIRRCAALALELGGGDLSHLLTLPLPKARAALKKFPGIGEPSADFILLAGGVHTSPSVESNGLRVLLRLGVGNPRGSYAAQYHSVVDALEDALPADPAALVRARLLLQRHGQMLCRRTKPSCSKCPLREQCPSATPSAK